MNRLLGTIKKRGSSSGSPDANGDSPEASVARGVRLFCESGGPDNSGEEVLHLPVIVDGAESSPAAAKEAANVIRKFLSKENYQRGYVQYNGIMLVRILADNPGKTFTRNIDTKFVITVKELLRDGRDMSVQQILRETLDTFETQKSLDETMAPLIAMWKKEKQRYLKGATPLQPRPLNAPPFNPNQQQNYFSRPHKSRGLPNPQELASRIEEAKTSAKLLMQLVSSTPTNEVLGNELIKEFADRCQGASKSIQNYIHAENPAPDDDTLLTLIETNDQLSLAVSKYQRSLLQSRRALGVSATSPSPPVEGAIAPPPGPPPNRQPQPAIPTHSEATVADQNPFGDHNATGLQLPLQAQSQQQQTHSQARYDGMAATSGPLPSPLTPDFPSPGYNAHMNANAAATTQVGHPGPQTSQSYTQRQGEAANGLTMHGAGAEDKAENHAGRIGGAAEEEEEEPHSPQQVRQYRF
ncbi:hypothetical protein MMC09_005911 [Bachmanniomyces sp. S44760]|nr:hypothetical protein [Bachmanniomyces sp. S44760]